VEIFSCIDHFSVLFEVLIKSNASKKFSLRSRRQHKAWGVSPRNRPTRCPKPAIAGDRGKSMIRADGFRMTTIRDYRSAARSRGLLIPL
jgi:hypothetical protein